jgi:hypothetical protein
MQLTRVLHVISYWWQWNLLFENFYIFVNCCLNVHDTTCMYDMHDVYMIWKLCCGAGDPDSLISSKEVKWWNAFFVIWNFWKSELWLMVPVLPCFYNESVVVCNISGLMGRDLIFSCWWFVNYFVFVAYCVLLLGARLQSQLQKLLCKSPPSGI